MEDCWEVTDGKIKVLSEKPITSFTTHRTCTVPIRNPGFHSKKPKPRFVKQFSSYLAEIRIRVSEEGQLVEAVQGNDRHSY